MAQNIRLRHAQSGVITTGFYGFSWTTLFFSGFPAIFRGDLITGVILLARCHHLGVPLQPRVHDTAA